MMELLRFGDQGWGDEMLRGMGVTILVASLSFGFGVVVAFGGAALKLARAWPLRWIGEAYTTFIRGVPNLVLVYILFFGMGVAITSVANLFGYQGRIDLNSFVIGVLTIGLISGGFSTEVIRGAILAVPRGQVEAARAVGMRPPLIFWRVVLPQCLRIALPGLGNVWQLTLKDTSLVSVMALAEIMRQAFVAGNSTRQPFVFFTAAALLYLAISTVTNILFDRAERRFSRGVRRG
ncbi:MAG: ABC transporter permease [Candidatus Competibacteraceae bacterium]|nr:ABC transporter permease [Candidatus Competibacteraceae bacterium]